MKNGTPLWREAHFQVKIYKTPQGGTDFGSSDVKKWYTAVARSPFSSQNAQKTPHNRNHFLSSDVEKWHAAVARSIFSTQNAQSTTIADQFWTFPSGKIARRYGEKKICKSKCANHTLGPLFEVPMFQNGTPLWREAYCPVKMYKTPALCSILKGF